MNSTTTYTNETSLEQYTLHQLTPGDEFLLEEFAGQLKSDSKTMFVPFVWDAENLREQFTTAINKVVAGEDRLFLLMDNDRPIALLALWGLGRIYHSEGGPVRVPTLGLCVVDEDQGKGVGRKAMNWLHMAAKQEDACGIELTTAPGNVRALKLYQSLGYRILGRKTIPLGGDPSIALDSFSRVTLWRREIHMYLPIFNEYPHFPQQVVHIARSQ
jgi:ribosomal protein S18 acetylase RimI-like enzyme